MDGDLTIDGLANVPVAYDKYFVSLANKKPETPDIPEFSTDDLATLLSEELADETLIPEAINDILDTGKIGFTLLKFAKTGKPVWCCGAKLTGAVYYPQKEEQQESAGEEIITKDFS